MPSEFSFRSCTRSNGLSEAPEALSVERLLLLPSEVVDNAIEFGSHLSRVLIFFVLFIFFLYLSAVSVIFCLILLEVITWILCIAFLLLTILLLMIFIK
jgi:hypothetical protein